MSDLLLSVRHLFEWVDTFPSSVALRESQYVYSWILVAHVVSMCMFAGLIVLMDLRLLGLGFRQIPFSLIERRLFPAQMLGFAVSVVTGIALIYAQPLRYYASIYLWMKMATMALAFLNAVAFYRISFPTVGTWDAEPRPPAEARLAGALGIVLWATVVVEGRLIPYGLTWFVRD